MIYSELFEVLKENPLANPDGTIPSPRKKKDDEDEDDKRGVLLGKVDETPKTKTEIIMKLKKILKESNAPGFKDRKFGAPLPTLDSVQKAYEAKQLGEQEIEEAAPRIKKSKESEDIKKVLMITSGLKKGGSGNRYGKEFDKAKQKALKALQDMLTYSNIGV